MAFVGSDQAVSDVHISNVTTDSTTTVDVFADDNLTTAAPALRPWGTSLINSVSNAVDGTLGSAGSTNSGTTQSDIGTIKTIVMIEASNSSTISVTNHETSDPEVFTFAQVDDTLVLMWTGTEWITVVNSGVAT